VVHRLVAMPELVEDVAHGRDIEVLLDELEDFAIRLKHCSLLVSPLFRHGSGLLDRQ
jgi:hypothetical protein